jgi:WD40-like Beta Propeller Repeat
MISVGEGQGPQQRRRRLRLGAALLSIGVAAALAILASAVASGLAKTRPASGGGNAWHLIFTSDRDGDRDVYGVTADGRRVAALTRNSIGDDRVSLSPTGGWLALLRDVDNVVLVSADGRREVRRLGTDANVDPPPFSPDGRWIAFSPGVLPDVDRIRLARVPPGRVRNLGPGSPWRFSPSGRLLAYSSEFGLGVLDLRTRRRHLFDKGGSEYSTYGKFSPHWNQFAYSRGAKLVVVPVRKRGRKRMFVERDIDDWVWLGEHRIGFERDLGPEQGIGMLDLRTGHERILAHGDIYVVGWSPKHDGVAYETADDRHTFVVRRLEGTERRFEFGGSSWGAWSPNGRHIALMVGDADDTETTRLLVIDPTGKTAPVTLADHLRHGQFGSWSPDGRTLALWEDGQLAVVPATGGSVRRVTNGGNNAIVGWMRGPLPARAPRPRPVPPTESRAGYALKSRGQVAEIAADGPWSVAMLGESKFDCEHVVAWRPGANAVTRFTLPAPCRREDRSFLLELSLEGTNVAWSEYSQGNYCHISVYEADVERPGELQYFGDVDDSDECDATSPAPPSETHRGVEFSVDQGAIQLRRISDGRLRTISPPGRLADAELEDAGLYYAFNLRHGAFRGRMLFVPFDELFTS